MPILPDQNTNEVLIARLSPDDILPNDRSLAASESRALANACKGIEDALRTIPLPLGWQRRVDIEYGDLYGTTDRPPCAVKRDGRSLYVVEYDDTGTVSWNRYARDERYKLGPPL